MVIEGILIPLRGVGSYRQSGQSERSPSRPVRDALATRMADCIFCPIANHEVQGEFIFGNEPVIAFRDIHPTGPGHRLIISARTGHLIEDLPDTTACCITHVDQRLARAIKALSRGPRDAFACTGGDHAHAHAHVIPMHATTDLTSRRSIVEQDLTFRSTPRAFADHLADIAARLRDALAVSGGR